MGRHKISIEEHKQRQKFGELLRHRRAELELSLREAARIAELKHSTLSRIESGERPSALRDLPGLEKAYKVPLDALQLARSGQIPSSLIRYLFESEDQQKEESRIETFPARITPHEKRQLTLYLGFLRFEQRLSHPKKIKEASATNIEHAST